MSSHHLRTTLVFGILALGSALAAHHECDTNEKEYCLIRNVRIESETDAKALTIGSQSPSVHIQDPIITYFPSDLMEIPPFKFMQYFGMLKGKVPKMHLKPTLIQVGAKRNQLERFVIPAVDNIQLTHLFITKNLLSEIPTNIEYCRLLETLTLSSNKIQSVNLSVFSDLKKLRQISLDDNQIHSVDATAIVRIPTLVFLRLDDNELSNLDMKQWHFPGLEHLYINTNMLNTTDVFAERFPKMKSLGLQNNPWSCTHLKRIFKSFEDKGLNVDDGEDEDCNGPLVRGICCLE